MTTRGSTGPFRTLLLLLCGISSAALAAPSRAIHERSVALNDGIQLHVLEAGERSAKPALVLIPGWTLPAYLWREQLERFSADRLVVAVDPRSQGKSTHTRDGNTPEQRARDLHALLEAEKIPRLVLVGWSQGAQDVAAYVQQFGTSSLAGIAFVDSPVSAGPADLELHRAWAQRFFKLLSVYANHPAEYAEGMARSLFKRQHPAVDMKALVAHIRQTPTDTGIAMLMMDLFGADRRSALPRIDVPALVVASAGSPLLEAQKQMAASIRGARLVVVAQAAHAVFVDQPATFDAALEQLLDAASTPKKP